MREILQISEVLGIIAVRSDSYPGLSTRVPGRSSFLFRALHPRERSVIGHYQNLIDVLVVALLERLGDPFANVLGRCVVLGT